MTINNFLVAIVIEVSHRQTRARNAEAAMPGPP